MCQGEFRRKRARHGRGKIMDITAIQKILSDAVKEYEIVGNVSSETLIAFISVDICRKLSKKK